MKMMKIMVMVLATIFVLSLAGCSTMRAQDQLEPAAPSLRLSHQQLTVSQHQTGILYKEYTSTGTLQWTSSNPEVATVSGYKIVPLSVGTTVITCTDGILSASCEVTVSQEQPNRNYYLRLNDQQMELRVGQQGTVDYLYTGYGEVGIVSSNGNVLRIEDGHYTAVSPGTALIICTDGARCSQSLVIVK